MLRQPSSEYPSVATMKLMRFRHVLLPYPSTKKYSICFMDFIPSTDHPKPRVTFDGYQAYKTKSGNVALGTVLVVMELIMLLTFFFLYGLETIQPPYP